MKDRMQQLNKILNESNNSGEIKNSIKKINKLADDLSMNIDDLEFKIDDIVTLDDKTYSIISDDFYKLNIDFHKWLSKLKSFTGNSHRWTNKL